jgi:hypothetical protein
MLPVMDAAFSDAVGSNTTLQLVVARDPRDICTGLMQMDFRMYGQMMGFPVDKALFRKQPADCLMWWGQLWSQVLPSLEGAVAASASNNTRIAVVRIEDLVGAGTNATADAQSTGEIVPLVRCILSLLGMEENETAAANITSQIGILQEHVGSYGGGDDHSTAWPELEMDDLHESIEKLLYRTDSAPPDGRSFQGAHTAMMALGYDLEHYGRGTPAAPEVLTAKSCMAASLRA